MPARAEPDVAVRLALPCRQGSRRAPSLTHVRLLPRVRAATCRKGPSTSFLHDAPNVPLQMCLRLAGTVVRCHHVAPSPGRQPSFYCHSVLQAHLRPLKNALVCDGAWEGSREGCRVSPEGTGVAPRLLQTALRWRPWLAHTQPAAGCCSLRAGGVPEAPSRVTAVPGPFCHSRPPASAAWAEVPQLGSLFLGVRPEGRAQPCHSVLR